MSRIHYRDAGVLITDRWFEIRYPVSYQFQIDELNDVRVIQYPLDPTVRTSLLATNAALVLVALSWPVFDSVGFWLVAVLLVAGLCATSVICARLRPRPQELRATYRGLDVSLYSSTDALVFGRVQRALIRARGGVPR
jgi:Family of unknown function (DUF6232)